MAEQLSIVSHIKHYWSRQATGALFVKLANGKLLQMFFFDGELKSVTCHGMTGLKALQTLATVSVVKSQFYDGAVSRVENDLPSTESIISTLGGNVGEGPNLPIADDDPASGSISSRDQQVIESIFTDYVGPIANLIFDEEFDRASSSIELVKRLSCHIDTVIEQERFKKEVAATLQF